MARAKKAGQADKPKQMEAVAVSVSEAGLEAAGVGNHVWR